MLSFLHYVSVLVCIVRGVALAAFPTTMEGTRIAVIPAVLGRPAVTPTHIPVRQLGRFHPAKKEYLAKDAARKAAARLLMQANSRGGVCCWAH